MNYQDLTRLISLVRECISRWRPPPKLTLSKWADENRMLSPESSAEPGRWNTMRAPYQKEIMDEMTNPAIETVSFMKSAQVGATEIINNLIGYQIDQDPAPILLILPTKDISEAWSKDRFSPMLRDTPVLRGKVSDVKSRDRNNTLLHKKYPGGHITIGGANSPAGLASRPVRIVLFDEVDKYPASAGTEGDPISLGRKRAVTFWNKSFVEVSTPTTDGISRIQKSFEISDKRYYFVPCSHCGEFHRLMWKNIVWEKDENGNDIPETAAHVCEKCGALEMDSDLPGMLESGEWRKQNPEVEGHAGFHINELYSPWVKFGDTVTEFLKAKNDPERLRVWVNTSLGEVWIEGKDVAKSEELLIRRENYDSKMVPFGGVVITVGVDVQDNRLELETVAWGLDYESWSLEYKVLNGDPGRPEVWNDLDTYLKKLFMHESGINLRIMGCGIDTGGHHTKSVYAFCRPRWGRRIFALKGIAGQGKPLASRPSKNNAGKVNLFSVGTETAKDNFVSHITQKEAGPGYCHFPHSYDQAYFDQLLSEKPVVKYVRGHRVRSWQLKRAGMRNEALDCRVYAMSALEILGLDLNVTVQRFLTHTGKNINVNVNIQGPEIPQRRVRGMRSKGYSRTG